MNIKKIKEEAKKSPVTFVFLIIIIGYFILIALNGGTTDSVTLVRFGAFFPPFISEFNQYYRFITSIFIHIGLMHLLFNSYALYVFGSQIESLMGPWKYCLFFFLSGIGGNLATYIFNFNSISAGASGSLFGILGAFVYLIRRRSYMVTSQGKKGIYQILAINLLITFISPSISTTAHLGGLIIGYLLSYIFIN